MSECRLLQIEVRDFKSFRGHHVIGPFANFSGIIGPNGSGKSNVLDALAFCLYLDRNPRSENYIHRPLDAVDEPRSCSVTVTLSVDAVTRSLQRQLGAETLLYVDGEEADLAAYQEAIESLGITPLSFVKQAEVDAIARKSPVELTQFFEEMSGSSQVASEYDRLRLLSESTHEAVTLIEKRRRAALSEKRHISVRMDEAAKFRELSKREEGLQIELALFQLFHYKRQLDEAVEEAAARAAQKGDLSAEAEAVWADLQRLQRAANDTRAAFLGAKASYDAIEQKLRDVRASRSMRRGAKEHLEEALESTAQKQQQQQQATRDREERLSEMRRQRDEIDEEIRRLPRVDDLESEISEYNTLRERASHQFSDVAQELRAAVQERNVAQHAVDDLIAQRENDETARRRLGDTIALTEEESRKVAGRLAQVTATIDKLRGNLALLREANKVDGNKQERLLADKRDLDKRYDDVKRSKDTNKRRERLQKAVGTMQRLIPGVHGRLFDLCKPAHQKYATAVFTGCGAQADAIVVKDQQVAIRCIEFLKEQGAGSALFLPLKQLQTPKIKATKSAVLLSSVLVFDAIYKPAVDYVCGSTAVVDTLKQARKLSFSENIVVVTMDGGIVEPGGILTGGSTRDDPQLGQYDIGQIEASLKEIETTLATIGDRIEKNNAEIQAAEDQLLSLEPQRTHYLQRKQALEQKLKYLNADLRTTERVIADTNANIDAANLRLAAKAEAVQTMDLRQAALDQNIFRDFCRRTGVDDIRQFEVTRLQTFEERYARRLQLQSRLAQLDNFISTEERSDPTRVASKLDDDLARLETDYHTTTADLEELEAQFVELTKRLDEAKIERNRLQSEDESNALELKRRRKELQEKNGELEQTNDAKAAADHERDTAVQNIQSILQQNRLSNIQLPSTVPTEPNFDFSVSTFTQEQLDLQELDAIDFKSLSASRRSRLSKRDFERTVRDFEEQLVKLRADLSQIRPDLKSDQRIQAVDKELSAMADEQEQLRKTASDAKAHFARIKHERRDAFMKLYDAIDASIDRIYKKLTRVRDQANRSGTAYLALEDTEEPYLGGIKFTAMPPHKRFRDLEQLSGGEKAVASLALVIALQKHLAAPFIVMDEPDASLDKLNLRSAAGALRDLANDVQIVSVSLKDRFFEYADILVGVYKDGLSSGVVTLDLGKFVQPNLVMEPLD